MSRTKVNIKKLKDFAYKSLPENWPLREILLSDNEEIDVQTLLARLPIWLKLLRMGE